MKRNLNRCLLFSAALLAVTACRFDPAGLDPLVPPSERLSFSATVGPSLATKSGGDDTSVPPDTVAVIEMERNTPGQVVITRTVTPLTEVLDLTPAPLTKGSMVTTLSSFNFYGYSYTGTVFGSGNSLFANNGTATYDGASGAFISGDFYNNPASSTCRTRYYAYTPSPLLTASATTAGVTFTYTAPANLNQTEDLCIGVSGDYNSPATRPAVTMHHALSAVRFVIDNNAAPHLGIGSIGFRGIPKTATATLPADLSGAGVRWTVTSSADTYYDASQADIAGGYSTPWFFILPKDGAVQAVIDLDATGLAGTDLSSSLSIPAAGGLAYTYNVTFDGRYHNVYLTPDPTNQTLPYGASLDVAVTGAPPVADITLGTPTYGSGAAATFASMTKTGATTFRITNNKKTVGNVAVAGSLTTDKGGSASFSNLVFVGLQESISLTPTATTIDNGATYSFTVSGTYPDGFSASVSGAGLEKVSQTATSVTVRNTSTATSATSGTLTVTTANQSVTASAAITLARKPASFTGIDVSSLSWAYNETGSKTVTISGSAITASDISLSSPAHFSAVVTNASTITVQPKGANNTGAPYNETLTITIGGVSKTVNLSQTGGKEVISTETIYNNPSFDLAAPALVPASGGTSAAPAVSNVAQTCYIRTHYRDGSHADGGTTSVGSLSYTIEYSKDNASFSTTHTGYTGAHLGTTERPVTALGTMYVRVSANGKSLTKSVGVSQAANTREFTVTSVSLSYSPSTIAAAGGTASPNLSYSQTVTYSSGSRPTITSGASSVSYSGSATGFSLNASDGTVTAESNSGDGRYIDVTATVTLNGKTGSKTVRVSQAANSGGSGNINVGDWGNGSNIGNN